MLLKSISIALILTISTAVQASNLDKADISAEKEMINKLTIHEDNFTCFQDLTCLISENPFESENLKQIRLNNGQFKKYVVEGSSKNEEIYAVYDANGKMLKATLVQRNISLPLKLKEVLLSPEFDSWNMIGNELTVQNFNKEKMIYKIVLNRDSEVRIEYFDRKGNRLNQLH